MLIFQTHQNKNQDKKFRVRGENRSDVALSTVMIATCLSVKDDLFVLVQKNLKVLLFQKQLFKKKALKYSF